VLPKFVDTFEKKIRQFGKLSGSARSGAREAARKTSDPVFAPKG
jgi:hypothetical protein